MGYDQAHIQIALRLSAHNDERDERHRLDAEDLRREIERLINRDLAFREIVVDISGP
jgi:hypothetical protein